MIGIFYVSNVKALILVILLLISVFELLTLNVMRNTQLNLL